MAKLFRFVTILILLVASRASVYSSPARLALDLQDDSQDEDTVSNAGFQDQDTVHADSSQQDEDTASDSMPKAESDSESPANDSMPKTESDSESSADDSMALAERAGDITTTTGATTITDDLTTTAAAASTPEITTAASSSLQTTTAAEILTSVALVTGSSLDANNATAGGLIDSTTANSAVIDNSVGNTTTGAPDSAATTDLAVTAIMAFGNTTDSLSAGGLSEVTTVSSANGTDPGSGLATTLATPILPPALPVQLPDIPLTTGSVLPITPGITAILVFPNGTVMGTMQGWPMILPNGTLFSYPSTAASPNMSVPGATLVDSIPLMDGGALIPVTPGTSSITILPHGSVLQTPLGLQTWNNVAPATQQPQPGAALPQQQPQLPASTSQGWGSAPVAPLAQGWGQSSAPFIQQAPWPVQQQTAAFGLGGGILGAQRYPMLGSGLTGFGGYGYGGPGYSGLGYSSGYGSFFPQQQQIPASSAGWGASISTAPVSSGWGSSATVTTTLPPVVVDAATQTVPQHSGWGASSSGGVNTVPVNSVGGLGGYGGLGGTGAQLHGVAWQPFQSGMALGLGLLGLRSANMTDILKKASEAETKAVSETVPAMIQAATTDLLNAKSTYLKKDTQPAFIPWIVPTNQDTHDGDFEPVVQRMRPNFSFPGPQEMDDDS